METGRHPADFPVFSFAENEMIMARSGFPDRFCPENVTAVGDPGSGQLPDRFRREFPRQTHQIGFFHFVTRMGQPGYKIAVVGKQNKSFAVLVQPACGYQPCSFCAGDQIDRFFCRMTVIQCTNISARFVQHDIKFFGRRCNDPAVIFYLISRQDPHGAAVCGPAVHFNPSRIDQSFCSTAGTDS